MQTTLLENSNEDGKKNKDIIAKSIKNAKNKLKKRKNISLKMSTIQALQETYRQPLHRAERDVYQGKKEGRNLKIFKIITLADKAKSFSSRQGAKRWLETQKGPVADMSSLMVQLQAPSQIEGKFPCTAAYIETSGFRMGLLIQKDSVEICPFKGALHPEKGSEAEAALLKKSADAIGATMLEKYKENLHGIIINCPLEAFNLELAQAIIDYLIDKDIPTEKIIIVGKGERMLNKESRTKNPLNQALGTIGAKAKTAGAAVIRAVMSKEKAPRKPAPTPEACFYNDHYKKKMQEIKELHGAIKKAATPPQESEDEQNPNNDLPTGPPTP